MNALGGPVAEVWARIGAELPRPKAILAISAHWGLRQLAVTAMPSPPTIHDFGGFPQALFDLRYPAPGAPELARRVADLVAPEPVAMDGEWGLDHGTWTVLAHMFPAAEIPVVQLAMNMAGPLPYHYEVGRRLAPLRDEGVLILGSGDIVHNLRAAIMSDAAQPHPWAQAFHDKVKDRLKAGDHAALANPLSLGEEARPSVDEHYLPLLYVLGATTRDEPRTLFNDRVDHGSISMLGARFG